MSRAAAEAKAQPRDETPASGDEARAPSPTPDAEEPAAGARVRPPSDEAPRQRAAAERASARASAPASPTPVHLGSVGLVRVAGLPAAAWCAAGNPALFDDAAALAARRGRLADSARALGERLGSQAVPDDRLTTEQRRRVLALRRRLHAGQPPASADLQVARELRRTHPELADRIVESAARTQRLDAVEQELTSRLEAERRRVGLLGLDLVRSHPALRALIESSSPYVVPELERRSAAGESWHGKRLRKGSGYLWRAVARAAAKTTPRAWAGQLALAPVVADDDGDGSGGLATAVRTGTAARGPLLPAGAELGDLAAEAVENVHIAAVAGAVDLRTAPAETQLAMAALHSAPPTTPQTEPPQLHCGVVDAEDRSRLRHVAVRRTGAIEMVRAVLAEGPRPLAELAAALTGGAAAQSPERAQVARGLLEHLRQLGVVQVCTLPRAASLPWTPARTARTWTSAPALVHGPAADWYLDAHRRLESALDARAVDRVSSALGTAARLTALRDADLLADRSLHPDVALLGTQPRSVGELVVEQLRVETDGEEQPEPRQRARYRGWRPAQRADSGYAALLAYLAARLDQPQVDIDSRLLDVLGAPDAETALPAWPLDCLLRPLPSPGPLAVLETASPAGILDARFARSLHALHGGYPNAGAYRAFLEAVERESGARFVELLVPPLAAHAANAVRRPPAAARCTGDANLAPHYGCSTSQPQPPHVTHLPLDALTLRRVGERVLAAAGGVRLLPMHHATRTPLPPWDTVLRLLTSAGHPDAARVVQLDGLTGAFPAAVRTPRLTVDGELVVSPARWRLPAALPWRPGDTDTTKVTALAALRRDAGLPRFGYLRTSAEAKPLPVDLAALPSLQLIERVCAREPVEELLFEEALPAPGSHLLHDPLHGGAAVAAGTVVRLPYDVAPEELAVRAAARLPAAEPADAPSTLAPSR